MSPWWFVLLWFFDFYQFNPGRSSSVEADAMNSPLFVSIESSSHIHKFITSWRRREGDQIVLFLFLFPYTYKVKLTQQTISISTEGCLKFGVFLLSLESSFLRNFRLLWRRSMTFNFSCNFKGVTDWCLRYSRSDVILQLRKINVNIFILSLHFSWNLTML